MRIMVDTNVLLSALVFGSAKMTRNILIRKMSVEEISTITNALPAL